MAHWMKSEESRFPVKFMGFFEGKRYMLWLTGIFSEGFEFFLAQGYQSHYTVIIQSFFISELEVFEKGSLKLDKNRSHLNIGT